MGNVAFISNKKMKGSRGTSERERPFVRRIHRRTIKKHFVVIMIEFVENGSERYIKVKENRLKKITLQKGTPESCNEKKKRVPQRDMFFFVRFVYALVSFDSFVLMFSYYHSYGWF